MKTANELAQEYFAKTPMERLHTTLQDYVFDYQQEKLNKINSLLENFLYNFADLRPAHEILSEIDKVINGEQQAKTTN